METNTVLDSFKEYLNDRLKSPYYASALAVWVITNRVFVFGVFNFSEDISLQIRILWARQQFIDTHPWGIGWIDSFSENLFFCLIAGFLTMMFLNLLTTAGKYFYHHVNNVSVKLLYSLKPSDWVSAKSHETLMDERDRLRSDIRSYQDQSEEIRTLKSNKGLAEEEAFDRQLKFEENIRAYDELKDRFDLLNNEHEKLKKTSIININNNGLKHDEIDRFSLLEKKLNAIDENEHVVQLSQDIFSKILSSWVAELLKKIIPEVQKFNKFFTGSKHNVAIINVGQSIDFVDEPATKIINRLIDEFERGKAYLNNSDAIIKFDARYGTLKRGGLKTFGCNYGIELKFTQYKYEVYVDDFVQDTDSRTRRVLFERLLTKPITEEEIAQITSEFSLSILEHVEYYSTKNGLI
ncbi:MAG: hypothetical protein IPP32_02735 [Bacteroidetes bacterium]|nr:hypothetical protein [Bacteroidota bacterium]